MNTFNYCIDHEKIRDALDAHEDMRLDLENTVDVTDPHLIERLNHPDADVRRSALQTLSVLEPSALASCADAVAAGLDDAEESVRLVAGGRQASTRPPPSAPSAPPVSPSAPVGISAPKYIMFHFCSEISSC